MIDNVKGIACIVSLKKDGGEFAGVPLIAAANRNYLASVNKFDEEFVPNRPYSYYVAPDPNFEALTATCIGDHRVMHRYVNAGLYDAWIDLYMLPLEEDEEGNGYGLFTYEMTPAADTDKVMDITTKTAYEVLKTCIKFRENDDFKGTMDSVVKDIRSQCESDGCAIILTDHANRRIDMLSFDHAGDFAPDENDVFLRPEFYEIVEKWGDIMAGSNCFIISSEEELKTIEEKDPGWYQTLVFSGIKTLVLYPLRVNENLYGYIFASNFNPDQTAFIREVMELNAFVLSAEAERFRMRQKLEVMSKTDMLTGVLNRNAMSRRIEEITSGKEECANGIGVVFVDANGLKVVNDSKGHDEGDEMLRSVAAKLRNVFREEEIYRAGGDEFLAIVTDLKEDTFYMLFERLKSQSRIKGEPTFALGAYYGSKGMDIMEIMHIADQNMYRNKEEYYELCPEADRRSGI